MNKGLRMPPRNQGLEKTERKIDKYAALGIDFSDTEKSIIDFGETLWNLLGAPVIGKYYKRADFPIGRNTTFTAEQGVGLYEQPDEEGFEQSPEQDLKFTLSRYF